MYVDDHSHILWSKWWINMSEYIKQSLHVAEDTVVVFAAYSHTKGRHNILIQPAAIWIVAAKGTKMCLISVVNFIPFWGTFTTLQKATISLACLSVHMEQLGSHCCMDFHDIWYMNIFRIYVRKVKVRLKYDNNNGYFTWRPTRTYYILLNSS